MNQICVRISDLRPAVFNSRLDELYYICACFIVFQESPVPVVLVENSGRCNKNELDEKVSYLFHMSDNFLLNVYLFEIFPCIILSRVH